MNPAEVRAQAQNGDALPPPDLTPAAQARADLWRLLMLFMPYWRWMIAGAVLSLLTLLANVGLMAVSGWFIAAMALAGVAGSTLNYFTPAALIRGFAIVRTAGRYLERLLTHEATFRLLAQLRVWFYIRLEPLAPAALQAYRGADLLGRIQADIESLNHVYLRVLVPLIVAVSGTLLIVAALALLFLLLAGLLLPLQMFRRGRAPGQRIVALRAALRETVIDDLQGLAELRVYGALAGHARHTDELSEQLIAAQTQMSRLSGFAQASLIGCATLAMWATLAVAIPQVLRGSLPPADLAMLALWVLAGFEAVLMQQQNSLAGQHLRLIGNEALCERYRVALAQFGCTHAELVKHATERGLWRVATQAGLVNPTPQAAHAG